MFYFLLLILNNTVNMKWMCYVILCHLCVLECFGMTQSEIEDFSDFLKQTSSLDQNVKSYLPEGGYEEEETVSLGDDHAWEKSGKFEGDLILNERQRRMIVNNVVEGLARNGLTDSTKRWPNNEVIYFIQAEHFSDDQVRSIQNGIDDLARASCVKFRPYVKGDADAVVIQGSKRGCFSQVGYQGGYQILNLSRRHPAGRGCFRHGTVVHELLHTLGFFHMQSSPDRDDFIAVLWDNIIRQARHNFRKYDILSVSDFGVGYDYESVLHYSRKAFSSNGQDTLVPKNGADIGQRIGLSEKDIIKLNKMYCDLDAGVITEDSNISYDAKKGKGTKNKPFVGQGIGYQKGKTVIIKLPKAETETEDRSKKPVVDYFGKAIQSLPPTLNQEIVPREEIVLYDYQFPKSNINEYNTKTLITRYPKSYLDNHKELKVIETNTDDKINTYVPNEKFIGDSVKKEVLGLLHLPAFLKEDTGKDETFDSIYYQGASDHLSPRKIPGIDQQNTVKPSPIQNTDYLPFTQYDTSSSFEPKRFPEEEKFLFDSFKQELPQTHRYKPLSDYNDSEVHSNENNKHNLYIQDRPTQHERFNLPKIRYSYK